MANDNKVDQEIEDKKVDTNNKQEEPKETR